MEDDVINDVIVLEGACMRVARAAHWGFERVAIRVSACERVK